MSALGSVDKQGRIIMAKRLSTGSVVVPISLSSEGIRVGLKAANSMLTKIQTRTIKHFKDYPFQFGLAMKKLVRDTKRFARDTAKMLTASAAGLAASLSAMVLSLSAKGGLGKLVAQTGVAASELDQLRAVMKRSGGQAEEMDDALKELNKRVTLNAADFKRWGIQTRDNNGKLLNSAEILMKVADRTRELSSVSERNAMADQLMGEAGVKLADVLVMGSAAIRDQMEAVAALGETMTDFESNAGDALKVRFEQLTSQSIVLKDAIAAQLAPQVLAFARITQTVNTSMVNWVRANEDLIQSGITEFIHWMATNALPAVATGLNLASRAVHGIGLIVRGVQAVWHSFFKYVLGGLEQFYRGFTWIERRIAPNTRAAKEAESIISALGSMSRAQQREVDASIASAARLITSMDEVDEKIGAVAARVAKFTFDVTKQARKEMAALKFNTIDALPEGTVATALKAEEPKMNAKDQARVDSAKIAAARLAELRAAEKAEAARIEAEMTAWNEREAERNATRVANWSWAANATQNLATSMGMALVDAVTGKGKLSEVIGQNITNIGRMVFQAGLAAVAVSALSFIPFFTGLFGPPGMSAAAGAAAMAAGAGMMAVGSLMTGKGGSGAPGSGGGSASVGASSPAIASRAPRQGDVQIGASSPVGQGGKAPVVVNAIFNGPQGNPRRTARELRELLAGGT